MEDFEAYLPCIQSSSSSFTMELLAQLRPSGWILDHFRIALDGTAAISQEPRPGPVDPVFRLQGAQAGLSVLAAGRQDPM